MIIYDKYRGIEIRT